MNGKSVGTGMGPVKSEIEQWAEQYATEQNGTPPDGTSDQAELHFNAWDSDRTAFLACYRQLCGWAKGKAFEVSEPILEPGLGVNYPNTETVIPLDDLLALGEKKEAPTP